MATDGTTLPRKFSDALAAFEAGEWSGNVPAGDDGDDPWRDAGGEG